MPARKTSVSGSCVIPSQVGECEDGRYSELSLPNRHPKEAKDWVMAVDDVAYRLIGELRDLGFPPGGGVRTDWIRHDHSFRRDDEDVLMRLMAVQIDIVGQLGDLIGRAG